MTALEDEHARLARRQAHAKARSLMHQAQRLAAEWNAAKPARMAACGLPSFERLPVTIQLSNGELLDTDATTAFPYPATGDAIICITDRHPLLLGNSVSVQQVSVPWQPPARGQLRRKYCWTCRRVAYATDESAGAAMCVSCFATLDRPAP